MSGRPKQHPQYIQKLIHDIVEVILTYQPVQEGQEIRITFDANPANLKTGNINIRYAMREVEKLFSHIEDSQKNHWTLSRIFQYLGEAFKGVAELRGYAPEVFEPPRFSLPFIILSPKRLYQLAVRLGIEVDSRFAPARNIKMGPSEFKEETGEIIWGNKVIPLEHGSIQFSICKFAYQEPPRKIISWDVVAAFVDGYEKDDAETDKRTIYDAIRFINNKTRVVVRKPLFHWVKHSFYRVA